MNGLESPLVACWSKVNKTLTVVAEQLLESIREVKNDLRRVRYPRGTRDNPARSCLDILAGHPDSRDGWYWVDPSGSAENEAIAVWCNMTARGETCLYPNSNSNQVSLQFWRKDEKSSKQNSKWFSELDGGFKIEYASELQLEFLRLLHLRGSQSFSYLCASSVAWFSAARNSHAHALRLLGDNEYEHNTRKWSVENVPSDGCSGSNSNSSTVFDLRTDRLSRLPITDFKPADFGKPGQQFGFKVGPVCFSS
jgi:collagen type V/XI/XXIV/XXVII alpha